jgi:hypothetical protein
MSLKCTVQELLDMLKKEITITDISHESNFDKDFYIYCLLNGNPTGTIVLFTKYHNDKSFILDYGIIDGVKRIQAIKEALPQNKKLLRSHVTIEYVYNEEQIPKYRKILNNIQE